MVKPLVRINKKNFSSKEMIGGLSQESAKTGLIIVSVIALIFLILSIVFIILFAKEKKTQSEETVVTPTEDKTSADSTENKTESYTGMYRKVGK